MKAQSARTVHTPHLTTSQPYPGGWGGGVDDEAHLVIRGMRHLQSCYRPDSQEPELPNEVYSPPILR